MMRYLYPKGMTDENFAKVCSMFKNIFVPILDDFMATPAYTNGNWGASVSMSYIQLPYFSMIWICIRKL